MVSHVNQMVYCASIFLYFEIPESVHYLSNFNQEQI